MYDGSRPDDYDPETGDWLGTCERCGTSHDGWPPDTIGGIYRCRRTRAQRRADTTRWALVAGYARRRVVRLDRLIRERETGTG